MSSFTMLYIQYYKEVSILIVPLEDQGVPVDTPGEIHHSENDVGRTWSSGRQSDLIQRGKNKQRQFSDDCDCLETDDGDLDYTREVTSDQSTNQKSHFNAPSHIRRKIMSCPLSKELRQKYNVRSMPIQKNDEMQIVCGHYKCQLTGKVRVYRKYVIYIERVQQEKAKGITVHMRIHPSKVVISRLKLDKNRKKILECKAKSHQAGKEKGKYKEEMIIETMQE
ncbi:60S ribosomal protein L26-like [Dipodomys spectabilis]|uniref:60S ribosomal protein L26-like n=1 Tax=Dipodomys spectabilis TaxID=105255 RepID=UPI001C5496F5|nr:60S ribosomal protein L26-like [Dipodomys spectabilis]